MGDIINIIFYEPLYNAIVLLYRLLGDNLGLAIIGVALISRVVLLPLTLKQIQMAESGRVFSDKVKEVKKKYKNDKEKLNEELLKLQAEYMPAQLAGCLPMIFQFILFIQIYRVVQNMVKEGASGFNSVAYNFVDKFPSDYQINTDFLHIFNLKDSASSVGFGSVDVIPYIVLIILVGVSQYGSMQILMALRKDKSKDKKEEKKKDISEEDFSEIMQRSVRQSMYIMPVFLMFISYSLPSGLSFYWISQSGFVIIQQLIISKFKKDSKSEENLELKTENLNSESWEEQAAKKKKKDKKKEKKKNKKKNKKR